MMILCTKYKNKKVENSSNWTQANVPPIRSLSLQKYILLSPFTFLLNGVDDCSPEVVAVNDVLFVPCRIPNLVVLISIFVLVLPIYTYGLSNFSSSKSSISLSLIPCSISPSATWFSFRIAFIGGFLRSEDFIVAGICLRSCLRRWGHVPCSHIASLVSRHLCSFLILLSCC